MDPKNNINTDNFENLSFNPFLDSNILLDNDSDPDYNLFSENSVCLNSPYLTDIEAKNALKTNNSHNTLSAIHINNYTKHN